MNDDHVPSISICDVTCVEGNSGTNAYLFVVSLSNKTSSVVTVGYQTQDGTATTVDNDYVAKAGTLTIPASQTSAIITVSVNGDTKVEANETFFVKLGSPVNATIADGSGRGRSTTTTSPSARTSSRTRRSRPRRSTAGSGSVARRWRRGPVATTGPSVFRSTARPAARPTSGRTTSRTGSGPRRRRGPATASARGCGPPPGGIRSSSGCASIAAAR